MAAAQCLPVRGGCALTRATGPVRAHPRVGLPADGLAGGLWLRRQGRPAHWAAG